MREKKVNVLFQMGLAKHPDLPDVPLIMDLAKSENERAILKLVFARQVIAWPYLAPPGIPKDRAEALRRAFIETMRDKDFLADAEKSQLEIRPTSGAEMERLVRKVYATPPAITQRAADMLK